jgi:hypothetical protein
MLVFFLALIVLLAGSLPWVALFRLPNKPAWLLAVYLVCSANVVLTGYIANSFLALNQRWVMLAIHMVLGGFGWLAWKRAGRPSLWGAFQGWRPAFSRQWIRREPVLSLFALCVALLYGFALAQVILIPQNNMDSLSTHLSRIGFWHQQGSFFPWPTFMLNQVWYPVNAQLQTYWTLLFLGSDRLVGAVQWLAVLISGTGVFGLARFYGYSIRQSAFSALIFLSFPLIALQSTTAQTDLMTAATFIPAIYFLFLGLKERRSSLLTLSAISIGIGIGVKKSYFLLLPVLAILAILAALQFGKRSYRLLGIWSLNIVIGISLFGSYNYVVNWQNWGGPFGSPTYVDSLLEISPGQQIEPKVSPRIIRNSPQVSVEDESFPGSAIFLELAYNTPRLMYQALDTSGLPRPLDGYAHKVKLRLVRPLFQWIGFDEIEGTAYTAPGHSFNFEDKNINEESHAWYGPLSFLLLFPAIVIEFWRGIRTRNYLLLAPGIALLVFLPMEIVLRPGWDPFQGRYFAPLIALVSPLMGFWFKEKGSAVHEWLISGMAVMILFVTLLYNPSKPTLGKFADELRVWNNDRIFIQTIQRKNNREMYYMVEKFVPSDSSLGYFTPFFILDYPLFGEKLERNLVPMVTRSQISDIHWLREQEIDYLLLPKRDEDPPPPSEYQLISSWPGWRLYAYMPAP